jgi:hypothetical protein
VDILGNSIIQFLSELIIFSVATVIGVFVFNKVKNSDNRYLDIHEFLPEDEIFTLRQVYYIIMISACFIVVLYTFVVYNDYIYMVLFDVGLSLYIAITYEKSSLKNKVILFLLVPWGSLNYLMFGFSMVSLLDLIHVPIFIYFIKYYYDKFSEFTNSNGLGVSILLLFSIVFISFFVTQVVENAKAVDSLVMVSNAFTSNGYAILGQSIPGKINSIFLVWGGYIISGAGTATLTAAILMRHFNKRFEQLEKLIDEGDEQ